MGFVVLFGVILSMRATMQMSGHADLTRRERGDVRVIPPGPSRRPDILMRGPLLEIPGRGLPVLAEGEGPVAPSPGASGPPTGGPAEAGRGGVVAAVPMEPMPAPPRDATPPSAPPVAQAPPGPATVAQAPQPERAVRPAPSPSRPADPPRRASIVYKIQANDSLTVLSTRFYGTCRLWERIYEANKAVLSNPDMLRIGQEIVIPDPAASAGPAETGREPASPPAAAPMPSAPAAPSEPRTAPPPDRLNPIELAQVIGAHSDLVEAPPRPVAVYTVQPGDTFRRIAEKVYRDGDKAGLLQVRNQHLVPDARRLQPGTRILLLDGAPMEPAEGVALIQ
jgi:nucleoid-associated protein YgaU